MCMLFCKFAEKDKCYKNDTVKLCNIAKNGAKNGKCESFIILRLHI